VEASSYSNCFRSHSEKHKPQFPAPDTAAVL